MTSETLATSVFLATMRTALAVQNGVPDTNTLSFRASLGEWRWLIAQADAHVSGAVKALPDPVHPQGTLWCVWIPYGNLIPAPDFWTAMAWATEMNLDNVERALSEEWKSDDIFSCTQVTVKPWPGHAIDHGEQVRRQLAKRAQSPDSLMKLRIHTKFLREHIRTTAASRRQTGHGDEWDVSVSGSLFEFEQLLALANRHVREPIPASETEAPWPASVDEVPLKTRNAILVQGLAALAQMARDQCNHIRAEAFQDAANEVRRTGFLGRDPGEFRRDPPRASVLYGDKIIRRMRAHMEAQEGNPGDLGFAFMAPLDEWRALMGALDGRGALASGSPLKDRKDTVLGGFWGGVGAALEAFEHSPADSYTWDADQIRDHVHLWIETRPLGTFHQSPSPLRIADGLRQIAVLDTITPRVNALLEEMANQVAALGAAGKDAPLVRDVKPELEGSDEDPKFWAVHTSGENGWTPAPDFWTALEWAAELNAFMADKAREQGWRNDPDIPLVQATVREWPAAVADHILFAAREARTRAARKERQRAVQAEQAAQDTFRARIAARLLKSFIFRR